jgi:uncharacterized lipoprotein YehR (DUF1307 family)
MNKEDMLIVLVISLILILMLPGCSSRNEIPTIFTNIDGRYHPLDRGIYYAR